MTELPKNREILARSGDFIRRNTLNSQPIKPKHLTNEDAGKLFAEIALDYDISNITMDKNTIERRKNIQNKH